MVVTYGHVPLNVLLDESTLEACQVQRLVFQVNEGLCACAGIAGIAKERLCSGFAK